MKREKFLHEQQRFSIRKYSFGAASVLLGASLVFAGQALADEHHEVSTPSDATLRATSDSDAVTAADIFSGVATDGVASSEKASQVLTTSQTASETATSEARSEVSASQTADKASETAVTSSAVENRTNLAEKDANLDVSSMVRAAVNTSLVSQPATTTDSDLPSQGTYVYKERTEVKNQPKVSAKAEFYVNPGDSVLYDQVVTADGYQWISYKSYSGVRRYAPVKPVAAGSGNGNSGNGDGKPSNGAQATTGALDIPATGTYYFTRDTDIKKEPKADLKPTFVFGKGDHVIYDKVLTADNHQWISYLGYDYVRYYADIATLTPAKAETPTVKPTESNQTKLEATGAENLPASGTYNVTRSLNVKNEPKASAETLYTLEKGYKVNYDKVLTADNHQWISYISYSGTRRYVDIATLKTTESKPQENSVSGNLTINNQTSNGFDVVVTNVSGGGKEVKEVRVPIWSDKNGQDDLTWYHADKQSDGSYKVHVDTASHKGDAGTYSVHLYYMLDGKRTYITETKATVPQSTESQVTGKLTINNQTSNGFDVVVTNVSGGGKEVKEVRVPIWSDKNGQDDLTWYHADKQSDGSYKVHVDTASHKGDAGTYSVHLYYMLNGKRTYITETKATVPQSTEAQVTGKLTNNGSYYSVRGKYDDIIIVNKKHGLSKDYNSGENPTAKAAFIRLRDDMINQGLNVGRSYSGFRSYDYQKTLYDNYVSRDGQAAADRYSARPGYSEHQTGLVFDLTDKSGNLLEDSRASQWLKDNAHNYGFIVRFQAGKEASTGYMPEAWHIRYVGKEAKDIHDSGLSLEEYFGIEGGDYAASSKPAESKPATTGTINLPATGTYTFTGRASIKAEAKVSSPELAYYDKGMSVNYDKVLTADGRQWLSYVTTSGARRYVDIAAAKSEAKPEVKPVEKPADKPSLPESGTYTFTSRASIKAEAKVSSPELAYYDKGMSVNYDKVLTADGRQWLSYVTASGARRYIDIAAAKEESKPETKPVAKPADKPSLPESGTYTFTSRASIKAEAKVSSPELAYYDKGMTVNYDKVLTADGRQWLSYVTTSGARRYVDIAAAKPEASQPAAKPSLPESGRYTFTGRASIKAEAKVSSPELAYYDKGMSVNYDKVLTADGHTWLSYMTVSGARRYVDIA